METENHVKTVEIQTQPEQQAGTQYNSRAARYAAYVLDAVILGLINFVISVVFAAAGVFLKNDILFIVISYVILVPINIYYFIGANHFQGGTIGKRFFGLEIIDETTGKRLTIWRSLVREVGGRFVVGLTIGFGYLMILWTKKRQGLHDKFAGDVVIQRVPLLGGKKVFAYVLIILGIVLPIVAIVGVIATSALVSVNPNRKIQQANDAKVKNDISQIGTAMQSFYNVNYYYPTTINELVTSGDLTTVPNAPSGYMPYFIIINPVPCSAALIAAHECKNALVGGELKNPSVSGDRFYCFNTYLNFGQESSYCDYGQHN